MSFSEMSCVLEILSLSVLSLIINSINRAESTQIVTCQERKRAVLPFHFAFISGPDDLHVSLMKMESIRDTKPTVIYVIYKGAEEYYAAQYRNRTETHNDLPSGKLDLILKHVEESDEGLYKCQATNKKNTGENMIQLYIERSVKPTAIIMAAEGESVTFRADFSGPRTEVVWKIGEDKLVEVEENYSHYYRLEDRASASFHSGSLTIRDLVESDSGHYSGNILTEGKYHETKFILKVSPSKPEVYYTVTNGTITVYCESTSTGVTYEWRNSSGDLLSTGAVYIASPETLRINDTLTCIVTNNVSENSSSVTIHYLPEENTKSNRNHGILIIVSSLTLVSLVIFLYKRRSLRSSCNSQEYPEESHVSAYNDNLLECPVKPEKPESLCDIDSEFDIKDVPKSKHSDLYTGRERENNVNNDVTINLFVDNWKEMRT